MTPRILLGGLVAALALAVPTAAHAKCDSEYNPQCTIATIVCQVHIPRCYV